jgi:hypothetical protein
MPSVIMPSVIMPSVLLPSVIILNVVAPIEIGECQAEKDDFITPFFSKNTIRRFQELGPLFY